MELGVRNRRRRRSERLSSTSSVGEHEEEGYQLVDNRKKKTRTDDLQENDKNVLNHLNKFKVLAPNATEAYRNISHLLETNKSLKLTARPNLKSEWIITPQDLKTFTFLKNTSAINTKELKYEEKRKKAIVVGFPFDMPKQELLKHNQIIGAERMKNKDGAPTKTMLCTFTGKIPDIVDLGEWGKYSTKTYYPEPLRCYNCQKYGHHKSACTANARCAVCSGRHNTAVCIAKHKEGIETFPRCPNCREQHPAWSRRCPVRLNKIRSALPKEREVKKGLLPTPQTTISSQAILHTPGMTNSPREQTDMEISIPQSMEQQQSKPTAHAARPKTILIGSDKIKKEGIKYTNLVLHSVGITSSKEHIEALTELLLESLIEASNSQTSSHSTSTSQATPSNYSHQTKPDHTPISPASLPPSSTALSISSSSTPSLSLPLSSSPIPSIYSASTPSNSSSSTSSSSSSTSSSSSSSTSSSSSSSTSSSSSSSTPLSSSSSTPLSSPSSTPLTSSLSTSSSSSSSTSISPSAPPLISSLSPPLTSSLSSPPLTSSTSSASFSLTSSTSSSSTSSSSSSSSTSSYKRNPRSHSLPRMLSKCHFSPLRNKHSNKH